MGNRRSTTRRFVAALCALSLAGSGVFVAPALRAEPTASDKETARALMKDGEAKRSKGDHKGAFEAFKAAHAIMNVPTTGLELGRAEAALGMLVEARDTLFSVTRLPILPGESANMGLAREEAQKLADSIEPRIPSLKLALEKVPAGATPKVTIDGNAVLPATIGLPRKLNPGLHEIVVTVGSAEKKAEVDLAEGEEKELSIDLEGIDKRKEPAKEPPKEEPVEAPPEEPPPPPKSSPLGWIGFGSAAAFGLIGGITGVFAYTKASAAKDRCDGTRCPPEAHDDVESSRMFGTISTVSFVLAGAGAVVGVIGLMSKPSSATAPTAGHAPALGLVIGTSGFALSGTF